jgi:hypothetical protein
MMMRYRPGPGAAALVCTALRVLAVSFGGLAGALVRQRE